MMNAYSVSIDHVTDKEGLPCLAVKLQSDGAELNVYISLADLEELQKIRSTNWVERRSLKVGVCLASPVFWSVDSEGLSVLVGPDDESWEAGIFLPISAIDELQSEIKKVGESACG